MIISTPTRFEIHQDRELIATVTMFDEGGSEVETKQIQNASSWKELSNSIFDALTKMRSDHEY